MRWTFAAPLKLEGDEEDEEDAGDDHNEDDDDESTPVPRSKCPTAAVCVLLRSFFGSYRPNLPPRKKRRKATTLTTRGRGR